MGRLAVSSPDVLAACRLARRNGHPGRRETGAGVCRDGDGVTQIVIVGGGIAGLSIAWAVRRRDPNADVVVLERGMRAGGNVRTEYTDGYTCECGPDGFLDSAAETVRLAREVGLERRLLPSNDAARRRYIFLKGRLHEVPRSPAAFLRSPLLSVRGKARVAWEPFARRRPEDDESIYDFAARRIGSEAAAVLIDSLISGIYAGDAHALSLRACAPKIWQLENDHGGLLRSFVATWRRRGLNETPNASVGRLTSFIGGMTELTDALTHALDGAVRTSTPALQLRRDCGTGACRSAAAARGYTVETQGGSIRADAVVLAGLASESAALMRPLDPTIAGLLDGIPTAPLAVLCLGYDAAAVGTCCARDVVGFLVPRSEQIRILGALWETSIYSHRAPAGKALLRVMIGGACDRDAVSLSDDELLGIARRDLARTMGLSIAPELVKIIRHPRGIPQYVKGHLARLRRIDALLQAHAGLYLAGQSYRGGSITACIADADRVAASVLEHARAASEQVP